jgi:thiol-disulfide isomerase/thioredoxin
VTNLASTVTTTPCYPERSAQRAVEGALVSLVMLAGLLGATSQASAPSDIAQLAVGKPVTGLTFQPIGGDVLPMIVPGKPTILIAFASWCVGCVQEMPRNLQDYARFKDRVNFIGVDYADGTAGGNAMIAKFAIPFPIERQSVNGVAPTPHPPDAQAAAETIKLPGVTAKMLPTVLPAMKASLPANLYATLADVAQHCAPLTESACLAYANSKGVELDATAGSPNAVGTPNAAPSEAPAAQVNLPLTFVIDANGIVTDRIEGYNDTVDPIVTALAKLGIH